MRENKNPEHHLPHKTDIAFTQRKTQINRELAD
jgi:hypothetical protein